MAGSATILEPLVSSSVVLLSSRKPMEPCVALRECFMEVVILRKSSLACRSTGARTRMSPVSDMDSWATLAAMVEVLPHCLVQLTMICWALERTIRSCTGSRSYPSPKVSLIAATGLAR